jgi:hypothetical protein
MTHKFVFLGTSLELKSNVITKTGFRTSNKTPKSLFIASVFLDKQSCGAKIDESATFWLYDLE